MAGIPLQFADFGNALASGASARYHSIQADLAQEEERRRKAAEPYVGAAMQGDSAAMAKVAAGDPKTAAGLAAVLGRMDANQRAQTKEQGEYAARSANAILQADPKDRPTIYAEHYAEGQRRGYKMTLPPQYNPQLDGVLRSHRAAGQSIDDWFKQNEGAPQPIGGAPGGAGPAAAISGIESGGRYDAVGPVANAQGNRAYGKYQVLDSNIGPWTQEVLGKPMTPQEFMANPQAQDAVFNAKFGQYVQKFGSPQAAARAWFAGEGGMNNPGARDVNGTTVAGYERKFNNAGGGAAPGTPGPVAMPPPGGPGTAPAAQMPGPPAGLAPPGSPAPQMPGAPPMVAQGDGGGNPQAPADPRAAIRGIQLPPGARVMGVKGVPVVKDGTVMVMMPDGSYDFVPLPQRKEPGNTPAAGPFAGNAMDAQAHNIVLRGDPSTPEYAAAYAHLTQERVTQDPATGTITRIKPDISTWARPPAFSLGGASAPPAMGAPPAMSPPGQAGGKTVTVEPGKGKPLDNSARDDLGKAAKPVLEMKELVQSFDPSFGGYTVDALGDAANFAKRNLPDWAGGADPKGQAQWWQRYAAMSNIERNSLFGASLTAGESKAWKEATVTPGMKPEEIRKNIERQRDIAEKALSRIANSMAESGLNRAAIEAATGIRLGDMPNPMGGVPQAGPGAIPQPAIDRLKANLGERAQFDEIFGAGAADKVLGR